MWVFKLSHEAGLLSGLFLVGYYKPKGDFYHAEEYKTREEAANRVHFLNGGDKVN